MRNAVIAIILLALLGIGGYMYLNSKGMVPKVPKAMVGSNTDENGTGGGVFTSIKDALSKSLSLKCVFKDEKGVETTSYIKNGAVRVMMAASEDPKQPDSYVMKDKKMYMWNDKSKEGIVLSLETPKNLTPVPTISGQAESDDSSNSQEDSILATIEKYKDACKPEVVADSMFTVPTDVKFQDMNALQQQMMQGAPSAPQGVPPGTRNPEEYQKYLQGIMQQQQGTGQ